MFAGGFELQTFLAKEGHFDGGLPEHVGRLYRSIDLSFVGLVVVNKVD